LIDFYLLARRVVDATKHIEYLQGQGEVDPELDVTLARLYWEAGETESAIGILSELLGYEVETENFNPEKAKKFKRYGSLYFACPDRIFPGHGC